MSIILTDQTGLVLTPADRGPRTHRCLDRVRLAPASSYAEKSGGPTASVRHWRSAARRGVFGHEHYAEDLERLSCAGVHP